MPRLRALIQRLIPPTYCADCGWWVSGCPHMN